MKIPQNLVEVAQHLGYPSHLFGFTPEQKAYWTEPGLPWLTAELRDNPPLDHRGIRISWCIGDVEGNDMAPRFPKGCAVAAVPVYAKQNLVVGKVYVYRFRSQATGEWVWNMGRLLKVGGNYLEVMADNRLLPAIWMLREEPKQAVWDVLEVTHYASYPALL